VVNCMLRKALVLAGLAVLSTAVASAQVPKGVQNRLDGQIHFGPKVLFSNFTGTTHGYNGTTGYFVDGANFDNQVLAQGFTPTQDATFADVVMPVGIYTANGGASKGRINVFLYNDAGGAPGVSIDGPLHATSQPLSFDNGHGGGLVAYTCFACPPLTAGTQYWIVAYVKAAEVQLTWDESNTDTTSPFDFDQTGSLNGPWLVVGSGFPRAAYEVDGN
jgi:hypothetical protein